MAINYKAYNGNQDFRGFLAANMPSALKYTGNDGNVNYADFMRANYGGRIRGMSAPDGERQYNMMQGTIKTLHNRWQQNNQHDSNSNSNQNLSLGYYGGGGGNTGGNRASAAQLAEYDQGIGQLEHGLGRVDNQLNARLGNIRDQYDTKQNELRSSWNRAEGQYNDQTRQNQQQRRTNINNINDRSAVGLRGLLRSLGSMGAVGSDMQLAGRAVQNQANQQRAGAGQTYAQNQRQIDSTWGQFKNDYEDEKKKSLEWKVNEDRAAQQQAGTTRQNLLTQLAQLRSQKAAAQGANGADAARADLNRANALSSEIDNLGRQQRIYTGNKVQYNAKDLDAYKVGGDTSVGISNPTSPSGDPTVNIYDTRLKQEEERKRQNQYL